MHQRNKRAKLSTAAAAFIPGVMPAAGQYSSNHFLLNHSDANHIGTRIKDLIIDHGPFALLHVLYFHSGSAALGVVLKLVLLFDVAR